MRQEVCVSGKSDIRPWICVTVLFLFKLSSATVVEVLQCKNSVTSKT